VIEDYYRHFTEPPAFLALERDLWAAWAQIQARGEGDISGGWWRVRSEETERGATMTLEVAFERTGR